MSEEELSEEEQIEFLRDEDEEENFDEEKHASLLRSIAALDGKVKPSTERLEVQSMSEHHAPSSKTVKLHELVDALENQRGHADLKKQMNRVKKKQELLPVPLPKPQQQRLQRSLAYESVTEEISKWDPIVRKNRMAEQIIYPLDKPDIQILTSTNEVVKRIKPKTDLELEVAAMLGEHKMDTEASLTPAEERALKAMSLSEARIRRAELQKFRALLSYKEAKARRQNKIKSKKYRRILRKEKLKKEKKALEELEKIDPEKYLEKLKQLDAERIQERISLKHRGGSKFARKQLIYNKYSDKSRDAIQEMLQKSRELTKKVVVEEDSSEEEAPDGKESQTVELNNNKQSNPWMTTGIKVKPKSSYSRPAAITNVQEEASDSEEDKAGVHTSNGDRNDKNTTKVHIDKLFNQLEEKSGRTVRQMKRKSVRGKKVNAKPTKDNVLADQENEEEEEGDEGVGINMSLKRKRTVEDFETQQNGSEEVVTTPIKKARKKKKKKKKKASKQSDKKEQSEPETKSQTLPEDQAPASEKVLSVDPKSFITISGSSHKVVLAEEEVSEDEQVQSLSIAEAFASDDVIEEFTEEKKAAIERDKPKDVNLTLPGWGDWGGEGIKLSTRKKSRFILKAPPAPPRKDKDLNNVIISEVKDTAISKHQVSELPFPFTSPIQFQSSIRQPIGKTWNPETAYKKLIEPNKVTRLGTIIPPMDKNQLNKNLKVSFDLPVKKNEK